MIQINDIFTLDDNYTEYAKFANENNLQICEIDPLDGQRRFQLKEIVVSQKDLLNDELTQLIAWFEEYDNQVKQYNRCQRMGIDYDKDIEILDEQARENAERITEIRDLLK